MAGGFRKLRPEDNPKPFKKGESGNPKGKPPKIKTLLKKSGYTKDHIRMVFEESGWQTSEGLNKIIDDRTKPAIMHVVARAFMKAIANGDYRYVSEIMQQVIGKPKESMQVSGDPDNPFTGTILNITPVGDVKPLARNESEVDDKRD